MAKYSNIGLTESTAIDQAGMTQSIGHDEVTAADESRDHSKVREIARPEQEGGFCSFKHCKSRFEMDMGRESPADQS
jgi:hypothetical protein